MANMLQIYEQCINNPEILRHGDHFLSEYLKNTPGFIGGSIQLIFDKTQQKRKFISVLFKNVLLLNWTEVNHKSDILKILLEGLLQECEISIQEIVIIIIAEILRRDDQFQSIISSLVSQVRNNAILGLLTYIYQNLDGQQLISYSELILQQLLLEDAQSPKIYQLVYYVIRGFSHCEQTDIDLLKSCFDSTFVQWMERFSLLLQNTNQLESQIYIMKCLNIIFKDLKSYSKQIRKAILPQMQIFLNQLISQLAYLEEINFMDETYDQEPSLEVLLFYTLQMMMELNQQQLCNTAIYSNLLNLISLPIKNINTDHFIIDEDPTVIQLALLFFEQQLSNKKTAQNAKQLLTQYLQLPDEQIGQYVIIQFYTADILDPNQYLTVIDSLLLRQSKNDYITQLNKLIAITKVYLLTTGSLQYFIKLFELHITGLQQQLGLVNLYNIGQLCAHAFKNNTIQEEQFKNLLEQANIKFPKVEQENAHILFDTILQMLKITKILPFPILQNIHYYWTTYPHDILLGQIFYEILEIISQIDAAAVQQAFNQTNGLIWLKVNTIIAKAQPQLLSGQIGQIAQQLLVFNEFTSQGILLLKTILQYNPIDQQTLQIVLQILEIQLSTHKEVEFEALTEHVHDLLLVVWNKHMNRQISEQLLNKIAQKILFNETPSTINGLTTILSAIYLQHSEIFLRWLQINKEASQQMLNKWLRFAAILQSKSALQFQIQAIYQFTLNPYFDQLFYIDPFIDKIIPQKAKMLEFLIQNQSQNKTVQLEDDEFYDVDIQETEFDTDICCLQDLLTQINISLTHLAQFSKHLSKESQQLFKKL